APCFTSATPTTLIVAAVSSTSGATTEMPAWLIDTIDAPDWIRTPPAGPGRSLITTIFCPAVWRTMLGLTGSPALAIAGTSAADPQRQPTQIGKLGSPCSNSTHTPAPIGGTR